MKTLLVPVDFSQNAENALRYAMMLSRAWKSKLILFHSYYTHHASGHASASGNSSGTEAGQRVALDELEALHRQLDPEATVEVEYHASRSEMLEAVLALVNEKHVDLIVMGTQGIGRLAGKFLGTNASRMVDYAPCPVLVVPESQVKPELRHIICASNYQAGDVQTLRTLLSMATPLHARLSVVHVAPHERAGDQQQMNSFTEQIRKEIPQAGIDFSLRYGSDIEETLISFLKEQQADLLVMTARQHDLFDKFFGKSVTHNMTLHLQAPILVFHHPASS